MFRMLRHLNLIMPEQHFPEGYGEPSVSHKQPEVIKPKPEIDNNGNKTTNLSMIVEATTELFFEDWPFLCDVNDTGCQYNESLAYNGTYFDMTTSSNYSTGSDGDDYQNLRLWPLFLLIFPFFTVFGNVLVIMSVYRERSLRTVTNYFICSLAIADIMVAVLVMPFAVYMEVSSKPK